MTAGSRLAELDSDRRRREGEQLTERRVPIERQQLRPMRATLTDKKPLIAVGGSRGDISMSASKSARCLNNHDGKPLALFSGDPKLIARARPDMEGTVKPLKTKTLTGSGTQEGGEWLSQEGTTVCVREPLKLL